MFELPPLSPSCDVAGRVSQDVFRISPPGSVALEHSLSFFPSRKTPGDRRLFLLLNEPPLITHDMIFRGRRRVRDVVAHVGDFSGRFTSAGLSQPLKRRGQTSRSSQFRAPYRRRRFLPPGFTLSAGVISTYSRTRSG